MCQSITAQQWHSRARVCEGRREREIPLCATQLGGGPQQQGEEEEEEIWQNKSGREKKGPPDAGRLLNTRKGGGRKESGGLWGGGSARCRKALIDRGHTPRRFPWEFCAVGG